MNMIKKHFSFKHGMSLLEIMMGLTILAMVAALFFQTVRSSAKESAFSGNHFSALMLNQKVSEDIMEEYSLNPYAEETLGLSSVDAKNANLIDGGSIFFIALEDKRPPWGKIESASDGGITQALEPLYSQLRGFSLGTSTDTDYFTGFQAEKNNLKKVNIKMQWQNNLDRGRSEKIFFAFAPRDAKAFADPAANIDYAALGLENAVKKLLPDGTDFSKPLTEIISSLDADKKVLFDFASARLLCDNFFNSPALKGMVAENTNLTNKLGFVTDRKQEFVLRTRIAKNWYEVARLSFDIVAATTKHMEDVSSSPTSNDALKKMDPFKYQVSLKNIKIIYRYFLDAMITSRYFYSSLVTPAMADQSGSKKQLEIILRLLDIYRILSFAPGHSNGQGQYKQFLVRIKEMSAWRNQYLYRFADHESKLAQDQNLLVEKFPNLKPIKTILAEKIPKVFSFINSQITD